MYIFNNHLQTQSTHQVTQLHITNWESNGRCSSLLTIIYVIEEMTKEQIKSGNKPIVVHCSDTVTRSGMFCAIATIIERCKTEGVVDVFQVIKAVRIQKPGAVPSVVSILKHDQEYSYNGELKILQDNLKLIYDAVLVFLESFDTYANFQ